MNRPCACACGLLAEPGDIYCSGCRSGVERTPELVSELPPVESGYAVARDSDLYGDSDLGDCDWDAD